MEPNPNADVEEHRFTYALYPHGEGWQDAGTVREAYKLNQPAYIVGHGQPGTRYSYAAVGPANVILETVKKAEDGDGVILRLYESENARTQTTLTLPDGRQKAYSVNLLEEVEEELPVENGRVRFTMRPFEIRSILVK